MKILEAKTAQHTPTPWKIEINKQTTINGRDFKFLPNPLEVTRLYVPVESITGLPATRTIADCVNLNKANAAFIVRAVNSHDELVKALKQTAGEFHFKHAGANHEAVGYWFDDCGYASCTEYRMAIAKAEGK